MKAAPTTSPLRVYSKKPPTLPGPQDWVLALPSEATGRGCAHKEPLPDFRTKLQLSFNKLKLKDLHGARNRALARRIAGRSPGLLDGVYGCWGNTRENTPACASHTTN